MFVVMQEQTGIVNQFLLERTDFWATPADASNHIHV